MHKAAQRAAAGSRQQACRATVVAVGLGRDGLRARAPTTDLWDLIANVLVLCSSRIVNLVVAVLMVLGGISQFFPIGLYAASLSYSGCGWMLTGSVATASRRLSAFT